MLSAFSLNLLDKRSVFGIYAPSIWVWGIHFRAYLIIVFDLLVSMAAPGGGLVGVRNSTWRG